MTSARQTVVSAAPRRAWRGRFRRAAGLTLLRLLRLFGWRIEGQLPPITHAVLIGAPHTSLWDGFNVVLGAMALDLPVRTMAKHTLFIGPLGPLMRGLGFFPVNRKAPGGMVAQCAARLQQPEPMFMVIAPEGTRSGNNGPWRTGFHRIAKRAGVPMLPVAMDYGRKCLVIGQPVHPTDDVEADVLAAQRFFAQATPRHPQLLSEPLRWLADVSIHTSA